ncbi:MAG: cation:proton antiporter [Candidatus Micrarchaeia archaeon]
MAAGIEISTQLQFIGVVVVAALTFGAIAQRIGLSSSIGYILAGLVLGPLGISFLDSSSSIAALFSELGLTLLLFYLGLEMTLSKFRRVGAVATLLAFIQMLVAFVLGFSVAKFFGFGDLEAIIIGSLLPMASTVMTVRFLLDKGIVHTFESKMALSILIVEDFAGILVLVFLNSLSSQQSLNSAVFTGLLFVVAAYYVVDLVSRHVLGILKNLGQTDKMALYAIGVGVIVSFVSDQLGLSSVLGAYFAGFALSESKFGEDIKREVGFFREFFILFFFVSFGVGAILPSSPEILVMLAVLLVVNLAANVIALGVFGTALGFNPQSAVSMGIMLGAVGEFSLIIAGSAKVLSEKGVAGVELSNAGDLMALAFLMTIFSAFLLPIAYSRARQITGWFLNIYPSKARRVVSVVGRKMHVLDSLSKNKVFHSVHARTLRSLLVNFVIVFSIVYIASLQEAQFTVSWIPFLPNFVTFGMILLPFVLWPLYHAVNDLKFLARTVSSSFVENAFPSLSKSFEIKNKIADIFSGIVLVLLGFVASVWTYYYVGASVLLVLPVLYTIVTMMYLSTTFFGLMEHYESVEVMLSTEDLARNKRVSELSREFNDHARHLRNLHVERMRVREEMETALRNDDVERARVILSKFKKTETRQIFSLLSADSIVRAVPPATLAKYPKYARKFLKFSAKGAFKKYVQRHDLNKNELKVLGQFQHEHEKIQRDYTAFDKIRHYLSSKKKRKKKAKAGYRRKRKFSPLEAHLRFREAEFANKLRVLPSNRKLLRLEKRQ